MRYRDRVTDAGGIALRYGVFYGAPNDGLIEPVRKRQFPIVGKGGGISSFIHLDDAAAATVLAVEDDGAGIYNIVDDEPAPMREWLPVLADALGAKPPRRFPRWPRAAVRGRSRGRDGDRGPRRLKREGQARARLEAALPELARRLQGRLRLGRAGGAGRARSRRAGGAVPVPAKGETT
jgi:nucleoside-diphosphate-sugar epimerase